MYHYVIQFSYIHVRTHTHDWHTVLRVATPPSLWPEGGVVVLQCLQTCCFVVFILVPYHTHIQSFSFITCSISQSCAQICPYYNVLPGAVFCCFNKNYNVYNMTLHAGLANHTCLQSFTVWYCSVYELRESNSKKKEKKKEKNIGAFGRI